MVTNGKWEDKNRWGFWSLHRLKADKEHIKMVHANGNKEQS